MPRAWLHTLKKKCTRREADSQKRVVSVHKKFHLQHCAALRFIFQVAFGYICGKYYSASDTGVVSHKAYTVQIRTNRFPQYTVHPAEAIPSWVGSNSYLVEVGGPVLSLLGLSFICELFVCSALHCHTALANLPNESQELHNNEKKWQQKKHLPFLTGQVHTNIPLVSFQTNTFLFKPRQ